MIFLEISIFLAIVVFCLLLGTDILKVLFKNISLSLAQRALFSMALALATIGFGVFILGELGVLYSNVLVGLSILYFIGHLVFRFTNKRITINRIKSINLGIYFQKLKKTTFSERIIILLICVFLAVDICVAIAPEVGFDSLWYHLEMGKTYLAEHKIVFFSGNSTLSPATVMPRLTDLIYTYMMSFRLSDLLPKLIHLTFLMMTALLTYLFTLKITPKRQTALIAVLFLLLMQPLQHLAGSAYVDLASLFFGSLTFYCFYIWYKEGKQDFFLPAALFCGMCLSVKLWNLALLPIYAIFTITKTRKIPKTLGFIAIALAFVAPFFIEGFVLKNNPVFPVFSISDADHLSGAKDMKDWLLNVHPRTFYWYIYKDYLLNGILIMFLPLIFFFRDLVKKNIFIIIFSTASLFLWSVIPVHEFRYGLAFLLPIVVLSSLSFEKISERSHTLKYLAITIVLAYSIFNCGSFVRANEKRIPALVTSEKRKGYLSEEIGNNKFTYYDPTGEVKKIISDKKALVMVHNMFYIDFKYFDMTRVAEELSEIENGEQLLKFLKENEYDFLVFRGNCDIKQLIEMLPNFKEDRQWIDKHFKLNRDLPYGPTRIYEIIFD